MHPAFSVIFFTTASGAGYGLLVLLGIFAAIGWLPETRALGACATGLALAMITAGLLASTAHLGQPGRAWRALSQWRSSWLSREGVFAVLTYIPASLFFLGWAFPGAIDVAWKGWGLLAAALALMTIYCTAKIYASLKTIRQWNIGHVTPGYFLIGLLGGALLTAFLAAAFGVFIEEFSWLVLALATMTGMLERVRHRQNQKGDSQGSQKVIQAMRWVKGGQPWMTRPYSEDLRERVVRVVESGTSRNAAAKQFDVSISFVVKLMQRWKQRGTIKADKYGGWKKSKLAPHGDRIRALVMENCDITIDELCVLLAAEGIEAKRSTLGDFLLAQGLSRKKRQPTPPSRSALTSRRREPLGATSNLG